MAPEAIAFVHRKALMLSSIDLDWSEQDSAQVVVAANQPWLDAFHEAETAYLRAYYGTNLERLVEIKWKYDPDNLFRLAQSIPLSL